MKTSEVDTERHTSERFEFRLKQQVNRAARDASPYAVLACVPQLLPGEGVADVVEAAAASLSDLVRADDLVGRLSDEIIAIGLPETNADGARVFANRLQGELSLRSAHVRSIRWGAGFASLPEDGTTAEELLRAAIEGAKGRRPRLAR
jgi:hypothetical protein